MSAILCSFPAMDMLSNWRSVERVRRRMGTIEDLRAAQKRIADMPGSDGAAQGVCYWLAEVAIQQAELSKRLDIFNELAASVLAGKGSDAGRELPWQPIRR